MADEPEEPFAEEDAAEDAPVVPDAADPQHHRRIRDAAKRAEAESAAYWIAQFESDVGRREMWDILQAAGGLEERFVTAGPQGFPQVEATWLRAGEQKMAWRLFLSWLRRSPDGVFKMLLEHHPDLRPPAKRPRHGRERDAY